MRQCQIGAGSLRWSWLLISLVLATAIALAIGQPASDHAEGPHVYHAASSFPADPDCDNDHDPAIGHCHASVSYTAFTPGDAGAIALDVQSARHALPASQPVLASRTPRPNLQPPQTSIPA